MSDVTPVSQVDLQRYLGRWYEIRRLPLRWEDEAASDITATYALSEDGAVRVDNRCFDKEGEPTQSVGVAKPADETNARLKVSFLPKFIRLIPFTEGDYWILKLDPEYQIALVGTPDRKHLWLLARDPSVPDMTVQSYLAEARRQDFDLTDLITPRHTGREVTDALLAEN